MAQQKRGLGKGLGALIPAAPVSVGQASHGPGTWESSVGVGLVPESAGPGEAYFQEVPIGAITPNPRQPRSVLTRMRSRSSHPPFVRWACFSRWSCAR